MDNVLCQSPTRLLRKTVDRSVLKEGISIPAVEQQSFFQGLGMYIGRGGETFIRILIDGESFDARIWNYDFDEKQHPEHVEIVQIRYTPKSKIALRLQEIFAATQQLVVEHYQYKVKPFKRLVIPKELQESLEIWSTGQIGVLEFRCYPLPPERPQNSYQF